MVDEERVPSQGIDDAEAPPDEGKFKADHGYQMPGRVPQVNVDQRENEADQAVQERLYNGSNCLGIDERPSEFIDLRHVEKVRELEIDIAL